MLQGLQYKTVWPDFAESRNSRCGNALRLARAFCGGMLYSMLAAFLKQTFAV
jgi:hypothetical protein